MNELLRLSIGGSSYFQQVNESEAETARKLARLVDLDLNYPPASENVALAASSGVQRQQQSSDAPDDECLVISPRKFEEAMNNSQRNSSRRVRSNIEDFTEVGVAQSFDLSTYMITLGISFGRLGTVNGVISLNNEVLNKTKDTSVDYAETKSAHNHLPSFLQFPHTLLSPISNSTAASLSLGRELHSEMEDPAPSSFPPDLTATHRRVLELEQILDQCRRDDDSDSPPSDPQGLLRDCALFLRTGVDKIVSDCSDVALLGDQDFEEYMGCFEQELSSVEVESAEVCDEIEGLIRTSEEDFNRLGVDIGQLKCSLEVVGSQDLERSKLGADADCPTYREDLLDLMNMNEDKFKLLELENQIDKNHIILKSLQDLECKLKWLDATEQFEDTFSGLKVISFEENCIRLSLTTYIPKSKGLSELTIEGTTSVNHELLIELVEGTMDLRNVEIFPNDVCIRDILDAAKSLSKSSLQWFVTKVQDRIVKHHGVTSGKE